MTRMPKREKTKEEEFLRQNPFSGLAAQSQLKHINLNMPAFFSNSQRARSMRARPHKRVTLIMVGFSLLNPQFGVGRGGLPRFVPICSHSPVCSDLRSVFSGKTPICSGLLHFLPICFQNKPEQIRESLSGNPFCKSPISLLKQPSRSSTFLERGTRSNGKIHMFLATIADSRTAASCGEGQKNSKRLNLSPLCDGS